LKFKVRLSIVCLFICTCIFCASCSNPNKQNLDTPISYFPTVSGSSWIFEGEGNEYAAFQRKVSFTGDQQAQIQEDNGGTSITSVYKVTNNSVIRIYSEPESYNPDNLLEKGFTSNDSTIILQAPLKTGTTWQLPDDRQAEIIDTDVTINTPAGDFSSCLKIKVSGSDYHIFEYYCKQVGLVKREYISGDFLVTSTLKEYTIPNN